MWCSYLESGPALKGRAHFTWHTPLGTATDLSAEPGRAWEAAQVFKVQTDVRHRAKNINDDGEWNVLESKEENSSKRYKSVFCVMSLFQILCCNSKTDGEKVIRPGHVLGRGAYGRSMAFGVRARLGAKLPNLLTVRLRQVTRVGGGSVSLSSFRIFVRFREEHKYKCLTNSASSTSNDERGHRDL